MTTYLNPIIEKLTDYSIALFAIAVVVILIDLTLRVISWHRNQILKAKKKGERQGEYNAEVKHQADELKSLLSHYLDRLQASHEKTRAELEDLKSRPLAPSSPPPEDLPPCGESSSKERSGETLDTPESTEKT